MDTGKPREIFISLCAVCSGFDASIDVGKETADISRTGVCLAVSLERCVMRIQTNRPVRFLAEYTQAVLALISTLYRARTEGSSAWFMKHIQSSYTEGSISKLREIADKDKTQLENFRALTRSFASHVVQFAHQLNRTPLCQAVIQKLCPQRAEPQTPTAESQKRVQLPLYEFSNALDIAPAELMQAFASEEYDSPSGTCLLISLNSLTIDVDSLGSDDDADVQPVRSGEMLILAECCCESQKLLSPLTVQRLIDSLIEFCLHAEPVQSEVVDALVSITLLRVDLLSAQDINALEKDETLLLLVQLLSTIAARLNLGIICHAAMLAAEKLLSRASDGFADAFMTETLQETPEGLEPLRPVLISMIKDRISDARAYWVDPLCVKKLVDLIFATSGSGTNAMSEDIQAANFAIYLLQSNYLAEGCIGRIREWTELRKQHHFQDDEPLLPILQMALDRIDGLLSGLELRKVQNAEAKEAPKNAPSAIDAH